MRDIFRAIRAIVTQRSGNDLLYLAVGVLLGIIAFPLIGLISGNLQSFLYDLAPEGVGIIFTVLVLDQLDKLREERQTRERLMREAHSRDKNFASQAIEELRALGWLAEGCLRDKELRGSNWDGANLYQADLRGADLRRANFEGADFYEANLTDAKVDPAQFRNAKTLRFATMPDGQKYDGRYNLPHDLALMKDPRFKTDPNDPAQVAKFYDVPVEAYLKGQQEAAAIRATAIAEAEAEGDMNDDLREAVEALTRAALEAAAKRRR
jgi:hypothetical protein